MRIAFITPEYVTEKTSDGGLAQYLGKVAAGLERRGHEPVVIVSSNVDQHLTHNGVTVHRVNVKSNLPLLSKTLPTWIRRSRHLNRRLAEIHRSSRIDVAQYASYAAVALFRSKEIPSVVRVSSIQQVWDDAYGISEGSELLRLPRKMQRRVLYFLEQQALIRADRIICPSRLLADKVSAMTRRRVRVVETPFEPEQGPLDFGVYDRRFKGKTYLLFFGTVGVLKGALLIADILEPLFERFPDIRFAVVGKDTRFNGGSMQRHLVERAGKHRDRIVIMDSLPHASLYPVVKGAAAVVLPSRVDNLPNTCLEAMGLGKIVIGTRGASFEQLIEDGKNGFLCDIDDAQGLLEAVGRVLGLSEEDRTAVGTRAAERAARLSIDTLLPQLLIEYERAVTDFEAFRT